MKNLPDEIWVKIYEYEGLYYDLIKKVKNELKMITYHSKCYYDCKLKTIENNHICKTHWRWWIDSIKYIKTSSMTSKVTKISNGVWIWNGIEIPDWLITLKKKLNKTNKKIFEY